MMARAQERRQPDFVVRAPDSTKRGRWVTVGAAWITELRDKNRLFGQTRLDSRRPMGRDADAPAALCGAGGGNRSRGAARVRLTLGASDQ